MSENKEHKEHLDKSGHQGEQCGSHAADHCHAPETTSKGSPESMVKRRSWWASTMQALSYVNSASQDNQVQLRISDRITSVALLVAAILTVLTLVLRPLAFVKLPLALFCDGLVGVMLLFYLVNRAGVLTTLSPRQALLTWQLILVSGVLGIFITLNLGVAIAIVATNTTIMIHP